MHAEDKSVIKPYTSGVSKGLSPCFSEAQRSKVTCLSHKQIHRASIFTQVRQSPLYHVTGSPLLPSLSPSLENVLFSPESVTSRSSLSQWISTLPDPMIIFLLTLQFHYSARNPQGTGLSAMKGKAYISQFLYQSLPCL